MCPTVLNHPELQSLFDSVRNTASYLWEHGWAEGNGGNLSLDITNALEGVLLPNMESPRMPLSHPRPELANAYFLVTGTGRRFRDLAKDIATNSCIARIGADGAAYRIVWGGRAEGFRPTSEFVSHLAIHEFLSKKGRSEQTVLHTHPTELIAMSHLPEFDDPAAFNKALWGMLPEVKVLIPKGVGLTPYQLPGSAMLAEETLKTIEAGYNILMWDMHGCLAVGTDALNAFDLIDVANKAAKIYLLCRAAGAVPAGLSEEQLAELSEAFGLED